METASRTPAAVLSVTTSSMDNGARAGDAGILQHLDLEAEGRRLSSASSVDLQAPEEGTRYRHRQRAGAVAAIMLLVVVCSAAVVAILFTSSSNDAVKVPKVHLACLLCTKVSRRNVLVRAVCVTQEFSGAFTTQDRFKSSVTYTGRLYKSTDTQGRAVLEARFEHTDQWTGERVVTTVLDHRVYVEYFNDTISQTTPTKVMCKPKNLVPPMGDLDQVFANAVATPASALDASNTGVQQCIEAGSRWLLRWGKQEFVYCRPANHIHTVSLSACVQRAQCVVRALPCALNNSTVSIACGQVVGDNFHVNFVADAITTPLSLTVPLNVSSGTPAECEVVEEVSVFTNQVNHLHSVPAARRVTATPGRRLPTARPCLFIGGTGISQGSGEAVFTQTSSDYWGDELES